MATVTLVVVVGATVSAVLYVGRGDESSHLTAVPPTTSPNPSGTPAARGGPGSPTPRSPASTASPSTPTGTASVCVSRHQQTRLTVVTFNIHSARAQDGSVELAGIANALDEWHADVVLLQEVDRGRIWTGRVDMPSLLASRLGMYWTFGANVRRSPTNQYGTAILSRYPILKARNVLLPAPTGTQQRGLLHATIDAHGLLLSVYDTHLENTSRAARLQQIRAIAPVLSADPRPELFGGDLNSAPGTKVLAAARSVVGDTWTSVGVGPGTTVPAGAPRLRIDYLFYRSGSGVTVEPLGAQVLPPVVSDHRAVLATYRLATGHGEVCLPVLTKSHDR